MRKNKTEKTHSFYVNVHFGILIYIPFELRPERKGIYFIVKRVNEPDRIGRQV